MVKEAPSFNLEIHDKKFDNLAPKRLRNANDDAAFLPPINKGSLENLRKNMSMLKFEGIDPMSSERDRTQSVGSKNRLIDSNTDIPSLLEKIEKRSN